MNQRNLLRITLGLALLGGTAACADLDLGSGGSQAVQGTTRVIVGYKNANGRAAAVSAASAVHQDLAAHDAIAVSMPAAAVAALESNPNVEYVEEDAKREPFGEVLPYGIQMVQADQLSDAAAGNRTVCIIDSGYASHEDLPTTHVTGSADGGAGPWNQDGLGHGTHVAGTIAAVGSNSKGVVGVNPNGNLNLHIVRVFGDDGKWAYVSGLVAAADECQAAGANVISMSLGGSLKSRTENRAFDTLNSAGILSIAAAGNDGNTRYSYPASYASVLSVAAIDETKAHADFSQRNDQVELSAPGVAVRSTVPEGTGLEGSVTVGVETFVGTALEGSPVGSVSGDLVDCGLGETACAGAVDKVCLIERGNISFADKVLACQAGGGVGAIIYNNAPAAFSGTLGGVETTIPSFGVSGNDGAALQAYLGTAASLQVDVSNYAAWDGTSMATPHVSGVAALVWSHYPSCTNSELRAALTATAEDLGAAGRDNDFGYGLVQAKAALDYLDTYGCAGDTGSGGGGGGGGGGGTCELAPIGASCNVDADCCTNTCKGKPGNKTCK